MLELAHQLQPTLSQGLVVAVMGCPKLFFCLHVAAILLR